MTMSIGLSSGASGAGSQRTGPGAIDAAGSLAALDLEGHPTTRVPLIQAAPPSHHPTLLRWRAAVGPVRFGNPAPPTGSAPIAVGDSSPAAPPSGPASTPDWPLVIAVWNTHVGGGALSALWDHLTRQGRSRRPLVLLLQEAFAAGASIPPLSSGAVCPARIAPDPPGEPRTDIVAFARARGLSLLYAPSMRNGGPEGEAASGAKEGSAPPETAAHAHPAEDRGCAIVANVPLSAPAAIELPCERQRRVAVTARATIGGAAVALCSLHLENRSPWRKPWGTPGPVRTRQMAALLGIFPESGDPGPRSAHIHILGGDLNTWARERREGAWRLARRHFPHPRSPDRRPTHSLEVGGWLRLADHLLFRLPAGLRGEYRRLESAFGSDHYPLVGTIEPAPPAVP